MNATAYYDPDTAPDPREWLALHENERIRLAKNYHESARIKVTDAKAHALFHAVVETQIAQRFGPTCQALGRLQEEGLSRHEACHAIGSVVSKCAFESLQNADGASAADTQRALKAALEALSASNWRQGRK